MSNRSDWLPAPPLKQLRLMATIVSEAALRVTITLEFAKHQTQEAETDSRHIYYHLVCWLTVWKGLVAA